MSAVSAVSDVRVRGAFPFAAFVALVALVALVVASCSDDGSSAVATVADDRPMVTTAPGSGGARVIEIAAAGAYSSTDQPCPVLAQSDVVAAAGDVPLPTVRVSRGESGATVFLECLWGDAPRPLELAGQWSPATSSQAVELVRTAMENTVDGLGVVAGFDAESRLRMVLPDGYFITISGRDRSRDELIRLARIVVATA